MRQVYVLCAKSPRALARLLASGLLEALAEALLVARERGEGVGVPRTRISTASVAAALAQPGLPPVGMWIAGARAFPGSGRCAPLFLSIPLLVHRCSGLDLVVILIPSTTQGWFECSLRFSHV